MPGPWLCASTRCPKVGTQYESKRDVFRHQAWHRECGMCGAVDMDAASRDPVSDFCSGRPRLEGSAAFESDVLPMLDWDMEDMEIHDQPPAEKQQSPSGRGREVDRTATDSLWPTSILRLTGPKYVFRPSSVDDPADSCPTGPYAGNRRERVLRLSQQDRSRLQQLEDAEKLVSFDTDPLRPPYGRRLHLHQHDVQVRRAYKELAPTSSARAIVEYLLNNTVGDSHGNRLLRIVSQPWFVGEDVGFKNMKQLRKACSRVMPDLTGALQSSVEIPDKDGVLTPLFYPDGRTPIVFPHHNVWQKALEMFRDPTFASETSLFPKPEFTEDGTRVWGPFISSRLFQEMYRSAPEGSVVIVPVIASDEAGALSKMKAYPVYRACPWPCSVLSWQPFAHMTRMQYLSSIALRKFVFPLSDGQSSDLYL
jgi:hypothetical protein